MCCVGENQVAKTYVIIGAPGVNSSAAGVFTVSHALMRIAENGAGITGGLRREKMVCVE